MKLKEKKERREKPKVKFKNEYSISIVDHQNKLIET